MSPIMRECLEYGCATLIPRTEERCEPHKAKVSAAETAHRDRVEPWRPLYRGARWSRLLRGVFARDGFSCRRRIDGVRCNRTQGLQGHHTRYPSEVYAEAIRSGATEAGALAIVEAMFFDAALVVTVCDSCHRDIETKHRRQRRLGGS